MKTLLQSAQQAVAGTQAQQNITAASSVEQWERARLVACSIEKTSSSGFIIRPFGDAGKVMVNDAAELAGVPAPIHKHYLRAWNLAAIAGLCVSSGELTPEAGQTASLPEEDLWDMYWNQTG